MRGIRSGSDISRFALWKHTLGMEWGRDMVQRQQTHLEAASRGPGEQWQWPNLGTGTRRRDRLKPEPIHHLPVKSHSLQVATGISPPTCGPTQPGSAPHAPWRACRVLPAVHRPPGFGGGAFMPATRHTSRLSRRSQMAPTWCEHTLVSFCHLLLSLKNYISICFHTFVPSQPPLLEAYSMNPKAWTGHSWPPGT